MEKVKKALHFRRSSKASTSEASAAHATTDEHNPRASVDSELAAMTPEERDAYLKEFDEAERTGNAKKGSFLEKLIERGNKRTEDQLEREAREREAAQGKNVVIR